MTGIIPEPSDLFSPLRWTLVLFHPQSYFISSMFWLLYSCCFLIISPSVGGGAPLFLPSDDWPGRGAPVWALGPQRDNKRNSVTTQESAQYTDSWLKVWSENLFRNRFNERMSDCHSCYTFPAQDANPSLTTFFFKFPVSPKGFVDQVNCHVENVLGKLNPVCVCVCIPELLFNLCQMCPDMNWCTVATPRSLND